MTVKAEITRTITFVTCILTLLYALYYYIFLGVVSVVFFNIGMAFSYGLVLIISSRKHYRFANFWFFGVLIVHIFVLTTHFFSAAVGFHIYFLVIPTGVFLLFHEDELYEKVVVVLVGIVAFFVCENYENPSPVIRLSIENERIIYSVSVVVVMIENFLVMMMFNHNIIRHEATLQEMASKDGLTGINNRRTFMIIGEEHFEHAKRYGNPLSLLMFDVDHFKQINDQCGHLAGDLALVKIAETLQKNIRASDFLARFGGEEFVIILPETESIAAQELGNDLRRSIAGACITADSGEKVFCTASVGISQYSSTTATLMELVHQADLALYQAKEEGRNKAIVYKYTNFDLSPSQKLNA